MGSRRGGREEGGGFGLNGPHATANGRSPNPFEETDGVRSVCCDRRSAAFPAYLRSEAAGSWHAVVDFVAFEPSDVRPILALGPRAGLYVFVSSDSVYMACDPAGEP